MARKSTKSLQAGKPYPTYPLTIRRDGRLCRKINGTLKYFGRVPDFDKALERYLKQRDHLYAGVTPPEVDGDTLTVSDLCNLYLDAKKQKVASGEIKLTTWKEYRAGCRQLSDILGRERPVSSLTPLDFERLRGRLANGVNLVSLAKKIRLAKMVCKYAEKHGQRIGTEDFNPPSRDKLRQARQKSRATNGKRMFEAAELRWLIWSARQPMRAMLLLAINTGCGATDIAEMRQSHLDLDNGWMDFPRPKNGKDRRCKLWPETIEAVKDAIAQRPKPAYDQDGDLVFCTRLGQKWTRISDTEKNSWVDSVGMEFNKLLRNVKMKRHGLCFYAIRHSFRTAADATKDRRAIELCMGHAGDANDMGSHYVEHIEDERLIAVSDAVRSWLWPARA